MSVLNLLAIAINRLDIVLGQSLAFVGDMFDRDARMFQRPTDQQTTVTIQRVALGTHHRDPIGSRALSQAVQPPLKRRRPGHFLIVRNAVGVGFGLAGAPPQLIAKKDVGDAVINQRSLENVD